VAVDVEVFMAVASVVVVSEELWFFEVTCNCLTVGRD
jgi:hypothetical protein